MKTVTLPQYEIIVASIMHDAEETAKLKREPFNGVSDKEMLAQIIKRIGSDWTLTKDAFKLTDADIVSVATGRFMRKTGIYLISWLIGIIVILWALITIFPVIPVYVYEALVSVTAGVIFYLYFTKLKKARTELREIVYHRRVDE